MLNSTTISSLAFLVVAAVAWQMAEGLTEMGSFFPRVIAAILALFSALQLIVSVVQKKKESPFDGVQAKNVVAMLLGIAAYVGLMILIGYILSGVLFLAFFILFLGRGGGRKTGVVKALLLAVAVTAGFYIVFYYVFHVPLPPGILFER